MYVLNNIINKPALYVMVFSILYITDLSHTLFSKVDTDVTIKYKSMFSKKCLTPPSPPPFTHTRTHARTYTQHQQL